MGTSNTSETAIDRTFMNFDLLKIGKENRWLKNFWYFLLSTYVCIGVFAAIISFIFECQLIANLLDSLPVASLITAVFEGFKVLTIVVYGILNSSSLGDSISFGLRSMINTTKIGLVLVSVTSSLFVINGQLDRPNLSLVKKQRIDQIEKEFGNRILDVRSRTEQLRDSMKMEADGNRSNIWSTLDFWRLRLQKIDDELTGEAGVVINGVSQGPRWNALREQKEAAEFALKKAEEGLSGNLASIEINYDKKQESLNRSEETEIRNLNTEKAENINRIRTDSFENDPEVHNKLLYMSLNSLNTSVFQRFNFILSFQDATLFLSLLISILLEAIIYISLSTLGISIAPKIKLLMEIDHEILEAKKKR